MTALYLLSLDSGEKVKQALGVLGVVTLLNRRASIIASRLVERPAQAVEARIPLIAVIAELRRIARPGRCLAISEMVVRS